MKKKVMSYAAFSFQLQSDVATKNEGEEQGEDDEDYSNP